MCVEKVSPEKITERYIDDLLNKNYKITVGISDTYYLYGTDKKLIMTLAHSKHGYGPSRYDVDVIGVDQVRNVFQDQNVCKQLYDKVDKKYNFRPLPTRVGKMYSMVDAKILGDTIEEIQTGPGQKVFLETLIANLMENRCPISVIERVFYCFDKANSEKGYSPEFHVLGHDNTLCEYKHGTKSAWRFIGEEHNQYFTPMNSDAKQIFDKVIFALHNHRAK